MLVKERMSDDVRNGVREVDFPPGNVLEFDGSIYPDLEILDCSARNCEEIDLLDNGKLSELDCSMNLLSRLDLSGCVSLVSVDCSFNFLEELELPPASGLEVLDCSHNRLTSLDLSEAGDIRELYCDANEDLSFVKFPAPEGEAIYLEFLDMSHTSLTPEWLAKEKKFPLPAEGCEDQLFVFGSPLADSDKALEILRRLGWQPVTEEE